MEKIKMDYKLQDSKAFQDETLTPVTKQAGHLKARFVCPS